MANLSVAILGLGRLGASVGLALKRYMSDGGKHQFEIIGFDPSSDVAKRAMKMSAVDKLVQRPDNAVLDKDIVVMALSFDEVKAAYRAIAAAMREGVVVLDASPLKRPSLAWSGEFFNDEQHLVGMTPILNPKYLSMPSSSVDDAEADLFDASSILLTPSAKCAKDAVDLAFNFCTILGSKPRFLDPTEHDMLLAFTEGLPGVLGVALFHNLMHKPTWDDIKWFTNPAFGVLTRPLLDTHPDALRDAWLNNADVLTRALDDMIATLTTFRQAIARGEEASVEALLVEASEEYEAWINHRHRADWDSDDDAPDYGASQSLMGQFFGESLARRLGGGKKGEDD